MQVYLWYPLSIVTGGTTAKIMVAAKDNFLGKYIYKDTIARNLAAVIYKVMFLRLPGAFLIGFCRSIRCGSAIRFFYSYFLQEFNSCVFHCIQVLLQLLMYCVVFCCPKMNTNFLMY